jgi:regulator of protease activity HflC (stomatin/prohibitin superfamily)
MSAAPHDEERLGELLGMLPPAPIGWVQAAQELPEARRQLDEIIERARQDAEFRVRLIADLETALTSAGYEPRPALSEALRARLAELDSA